MKNRMKLSLILFLEFLFFLSTVATAFAISSDDFSAPALNTYLWTVVNPRNDATFTMTGTGTSDAFLSISVPAGSSHDVWSGNMAPRIMQAASNTDFEVKVKFQSQLTTQYQIQGIIVQQDSNNYLRFDFVKDATRTRAFAASFTNGSPTVRSDVQITPGNPLYLRVKRIGNQWTQSYSSNGTNWTTATSFTHTLTVTSIGPFAGNAGFPESTSPAFTCLIDYFFNTASPIAPEDGGDTTPPVINVWYGPSQVFGQIGIPQIWVNILGNVSDSSGIALLTYSLNGRPSLPLSIGPDGKRLQSSGDFNIDIAYADLLCSPTLNQVAITATDNSGNITVNTVDVKYACGNVWPETYSINWSTVTNIQDVAQVVDGLWTLEANSIRPVVVGYDRLIAIGDINWDDYEVTVPITIHSLDSSVPYGPLMGIAVRWQGHYDWDGSQPRYGWWPLGALGLYDWVPDSQDYRLRIIGNSENLIAEDTSGRHLTVGVPYMFKMRVETVGENSIYYLKVWEEGTSEPSGWNITGQGIQGELKHGSILLITHYTDVSFGNVTITPGLFPGDTTPPVINNIMTAVDVYSATISWTTDELSTSKIAYGPSLAYKNGSIVNSELVTSHSITLTGLAPVTLYHYQITSADGSGNSSSSTNLTFTTSSAQSSIVSDDFSASSLNTGLWTFINPRGDATVTMTGNNVKISIPAGTSHDVWTGGNFAPRIMQPAQNKDFGIEVKFESALSGRTQSQGLIIEQDSSNYLRFDFYSDGSNTIVFAASFSNGSPTIRKNSVISGVPSAVPIYMWVKRAGNQWTQSYSYDGSNWATSITFTHIMSVRSVGAFIGNALNNPAFTGSIDYFFNTASPIIKAPVITSQPMNQTVATSQAATFSVVATGAASLSYQWQKNEVNIPGATSVSYTTPPTTLADNGSTFRCIVTNPAGSVTSNTVTLTVTNIVSDIVSDDFSALSLNTGLWTFINPRGDATVTMTGNNVKIPIPAGTSHDVWTGGNFAPRIMQPAQNKDFGIEVKFESALSGRAQMQGLIIEQDSSNYLRFDFYSDGSNTRVFAASFSNGSPTIRNNSVISGVPSAVPIYMRVKRAGNQWTQSYSYDGSNWTTSITFTHIMSVISVGAFIGNALNNPAFTGSVDYFFNTASPIIPEDGMAFALL